MEESYIDVFPVVLLAGSMCPIGLFVVLQVYFVLKLNGCTYCVYFVLKAKYIYMRVLCLSILMLVVFRCVCPCA